MSRSFISFVVALFCLLTLPALAQISGVVNTYVAVTAVDYTQHEVTVTNSAGYSVGDKVMLIQMNGATIDETNTASFGDVTAVNDAGNYELKEICGVSGNTISFLTEVVRSYDPVGGAVQLVRIPVYSNVSVTGTLLAAPWNGSTGGVIAIEATGTITLNADIDATGLGFLGGIPNANVNSVCDVTTYFLPNTATTGGGKGEGIAGVIVGKENARGKQANGGGGGNSYNAGGAGGSNSGLGGGGSFGYDGGTCAGDPVGGISGLALTYANASNRVYMGGGGGAGHSNSADATSGGDGGGIVLVIANELDGNSNFIRANGEDANDAIATSADGAGGGGSGGVVLIDVKIYSDIVNLQVDGGKGGDNQNTMQCVGPGGGGGGGTIWSTGALPGAVITSNNGGVAGTKVGGPGGCAGTNYGAVAGLPGQSLIGLNFPIGTDPYAGDDGNLFVCSDQTLVPLAPGLAGNPTPGGNWLDDDNTGAMNGGNFNPSVVGGGTYHFTYYLNSGTCATDSGTVTVDVTQAPDAGQNGVLSVCQYDTAVDLLANLGGTPQAGGLWTDDDGTGALQNGFFSPAGQNAGTYHFTYHVFGSGPCPDDSATVSVNVILPPNAGVDNSVASCTSESSLDLFSVLVGTPDAGGSWNDNDNSGASSGNMFDPSLAGPGIWTFTYVVLGVGPCANDSATVTVNVTNTVSAGTNTAVTVCGADNNIDLLGLLGGSPDPGGAWLDDDATGALTGAFFDATTVAAGTYDFTYAILALGGCAADSATLTVTVSNGGNAGISTNLASCTSSSLVDLFASLAGNPDTGGTWNDDDGSGALSGSQFDPSAVTSGVYNFTYVITASAPCQNDSATVTVSVAPGPDAGTGNTVSICSSEASYDLFAQLGGTPDAGGSWSDDDNTGGLNGGILNANGVASGSYDFTYTVVGLGACPNAAATITVNLTAAPNAGGPGVISVCSTVTNADLFTGLTGLPDLTGTWFDTGGSGALSGSTFDASTAGLGTWLFTYVVTGSAPCVNDTATVAVIVTAAPSAGTPGTINACGTDAAVNLFGGLGGNPITGGTWNDDNTTGALSGGFFDASAVTPGSSYDFTYVVGVSGCPADSATVTVTVLTPPNAGTGDTIYACQVGTLDLTTGLIGADVGGTWNDDDNTGELTGSVLNTANMGLGTFTFTYTVSGSSPCFPSSTVVTIIMTTTPDAGLPGSVGGCASGPVVDLFTGLGGNPDLYGTWTDNSSSGGLSGSTFDPSVPGQGIYSFTYSVTAVGCGTATANVTVGVGLGPNPGIDSTGVTCQAITAYDLFNALGGTPDAGGTWLDDSNTGALTGNLFDPTQVPFGVYQFTYVVPGAGSCAPDSATVQVTVGSGSNAGTGTNVFICSLDTAYNLMGALGGNPDAGGVWNDNDNTGAVTGNLFNAGQVAVGTYSFTYVVSACGIDSTSITVTVTAGNNAGSNASVPVCEDDTAYDLFTALAGSPDAGGVWTDNDNTGALNNGIFDASIPGAGIYQFTYSFQASGACPSTSATVTVVVVQSTDAGADNAVTVCETDQTVDLFGSLGGTPQQGGVWMDDDNAGGLSGANFDASVAGPGTFDFTYVVSGCSMDSATVTVTVLAGANAGVDTTIQVCDQNTAFDLLTGLAGNPDAGGIWNDNNATGALTGSSFNATIPGQGTYSFAYLVLGTAPCVNASSILTVNVVGTPNAGTGDTLIACVGESFLDLTTGFSTPGDNTGIWLDDDNTGAVSGNGLNPSTAGEGLWHFTYLVTAAGCPDDQTTVVVDVRGEPDAGLGDTITLCSSLGAVDLFTYLGGTPDLTGTWNDNSQSGVLSGATADLTTLEGTFLYTYNVASVGICPPSQSQLWITVISLPNAGVNIGDTLETCDEIVNLFEGLTGNVDQTGTWTDLDGSGGLFGALFQPTQATEGVWNFRYDVAGQGICPDDQSNVVVHYDCIDDVPPVPEGFSPNGDGVNDFFFIADLSLFPENHFTVFNRWGRMVFEAEPYRNDWDGTWQNGDEFGKPLPEGTYYYVLELRDDLDPIKGYIYIKR